MALIKCPECGGRVSNYADRCPHCGYDIAAYFSESYETEKNSQDYSQNCPQVMQYSQSDNQQTNYKYKKKKTKRNIWIYSAILISIVLFVVFVIINSKIQTQKYIDSISESNGETASVQQTDTPSPTSTTYKSSSSSYSSSSSSYSSTERKVYAKLHAEAFVEKYLKSPSTAKFPNYTKYTYDLSGSTWTVSGYVDAENSFGATIRQYFTVSFTVSSDLNNATLVSIDFD